MYIHWTLWWRIVLIHILQRILCVLMRTNKIYISSSSSSVRAELVVEYNHTVHMTQ